MTGIHRTQISAICLLFAASCFAQLPNAKLTPGATVKATKAEICTRGYSVKTRREYPVTPKTKRYVLRLYGFPPGTKGYIFDHKIPVELGGANTVNNIQPQRPAAAHHKDLAENAARKLVCDAGTVSLEKAQQDFGRGNFEKYLGGRNR